MESASVSTPRTSLADGASPSREPADATDGKRASKRPFVIVGLVILAGIAALVIYVMRTRGHESTDDAQVEGDVVTISVRVPGLVVAVPAEDNHRIKKGELDRPGRRHRLCGATEASAGRARAGAGAGRAGRSAGADGRRERQGGHRRRTGRRCGFVLCRT